MGFVVVVKEKWKPHGIWQQTKSEIWHYTSWACSKLLNSCLLLLLLSHFSHVWLCATPWMAAHEAPPVPGILQARTLEWVAISFSNAWKWKMKVKSLSCVRLLATPWTTAHQALRPWDFPGKSTGVGCHCLLQQLPTPSQPSLAFAYNSWTCLRHYHRMMGGRKSFPPSQE